MTIISNIDIMLAKRKMIVTEIVEKVSIVMANISVLKTTGSFNDAEMKAALVQFFSP